MKISPFTISITTLVLSMLACNLGASAPTTDSAQPTQDGSGVVAPTPAATEAALAAPNACDHPYVPIIAGATWNYNLVGPENDTFTRSILAVTVNGFSEQDVFGVGVTRQGEWKCDGGNLIALTPSGGGTTSITSENTSVDFKTTSLEGVTLPASVNPGDNWSQSLTLEGTQTINGESFPAKNQTTQNCTAVGIEAVSVPAGTFDAMRVECDVNIDLTLEMAGNPISTTLVLKNTTWYATKVGLVKNITTGSGLDSTVELTSYSIP